MERGKGRIIRNILREREQWRKKNQQIVGVSLAHVPKRLPRRWCCAGTMGAVSCVYFRFPVSVSWTHSLNRKLPPAVPPLLYATPWSEKSHPCTLQWFSRSQEKGRSVSQSVTCSSDLSTRHAIVSVGAHTQWPWHRLSGQWHCGVTII